MQLNELVPPQRSAHQSVVTRKPETVRIVVSSGKVSLYAEDRLLWTAFADGEVRLFKMPTLGRMVVLRTNVGFDVFDSGGMHLRSRSFSAYRDPRPWIVGTNRLVWGEGVYNWIHLDDPAEWAWQNDRRRFYTMDLKSGRITSLGGLAKVGVPFEVRQDRIRAMRVAPWGPQSILAWSCIQGTTIDATSGRIVQLKKIKAGRPIAKAIAGYVLGTGVVLPEQRNAMARLYSRR